MEREHSDHSYLTLYHFNWDVTYILNQPYLCQALALALALTHIFILTLAITLTLTFTSISHVISIIEWDKRSQC